MPESIEEMSETRWPVPADSTVPSGGNQKALSRYITAYFNELKKTDPQLFNADDDLSLILGEVPEPTADDSEKDCENYIREQNRIFKKYLGTDSSRTSRTSKPSKSGTQSTSSTPSTPSTPSKPSESADPNSNSKPESYESYTQLSQAEHQHDLQDKPLTASMDLYLAALDEKVYMSVNNSRAAIGIRDKELRNEILKLEEIFSGSDFAELSSREKMLKLIIQLRDKYRVLWTKQIFLSQQRDQVECDLSTLRNDHALQLAKVFRLQYATHCLGKKLLETEGTRTRNLELEDQVEKQNRELTQLREENERLKLGLNTKEYTADLVPETAPEGTDPMQGPPLQGSGKDAQQSPQNGRALSKNSKNSKPQDGQNNQTSTDKVEKSQPGQASQASQANNSEQLPANSVEARVQTLYKEVAKLKHSQLILDKYPQDETDVVTTLMNLIALIEVNQRSNDEKQVQLVKAFLNQHHSREAELLTQIKVLEKEKQIILSKCEHFEKKYKLVESDLLYAEKRSLSMVLMMKNMKAFFEKE
ncbi:hypothetical protein DASB73_036710 [Starmerella bacillaris]|uniref:Uncharacterized protein n=1 Tax=Starmerella bacillaris TaxID=1247836 RepID=A0AAV5RPP8_STABA|nr:hypothetical protein DASB73_036710 [Starmerella bacillaris]